MDIKIVATTGRAQGEAVSIRATKFFIGRHDNCQLKPNIEGLAGIHALIEQRENRLYLRDFGAEGGTGINDRVLHARETELFHGDLIQVGPMVLSLTVQPKPPDPPVRAHAYAPDGWPYFEPGQGESTGPVAREPDRAQAAPPPPLLARPPAEPVAPRRSAQPEPAAHATLAPAPAPTPAPAKAPRPELVGAIPTRHHHRAIACVTIDGVLVARILPPELNEEGDVSPVRYELRSLLDDQPPSRMVIDLGDTRYLSSRAVGVILAHYQGLERQGGTLRVCGVSRQIKPVLDQMRLSMLIDIYPTAEEAVRDSWD